MEKVYEIVIGLNDKDTKQQKISTVEAYKLTENLLCHHIGGGSIFEGMGIYTHENGHIVRERSLSVKTSTTNHQAVLDFVAAVKAALNQESVYMQQMEVNVSFI